MDLEELERLEKEYEPIDVHYNRLESTCYHELDVNGKCILCGITPDYTYIEDEDDYFE